MRRAVFLDRDGVINAMVGCGATIDSPQHPDEFCLLPGAAEAVSRLNRLGFPVIVVSNQPGIAKGKSSVPLLDETTARLHRRLGAAGAALTAVYYCLHHPEATVEEYRARCACRKPSAGLLREASRDFGIELAGSYLVGDQPRDIEAGHSVGCVTVWVRPPDWEGDRLSPTDPDLRPTHVCSSLAEAALWIERRESAVTENLVEMGPDGDLCRHGGPGRDQALASLRGGRRRDDQPLYYVGGRRL